MVIFDQFLHTHTHGMLGKVFPKLSGYRLKNLPNRHIFTVVCLVALSLNESEAGGDLVLTGTLLIADRKSVV